MWSPDCIKFSQRADWMALLARATLAELQSALAAEAVLEPIWLRAPQVGLMMVRGRLGGEGQAFNIGELTVTRCALRMPWTDSAGPSGMGIDRDVPEISSAGRPVGVAWVLGRSPDKARLAAIADAGLQHDERHSALVESLLLPIQLRLRREGAAARERALETRVNFMTVVRESGKGVST